MPYYVNIRGWPQNTVYDVMDERFNLITETYEGTLCTLYDAEKYMLNYRFKKKTYAKYFLSECEKLDIKADIGK